MFSRSLFHHRPSAIVRIIALFALLLVIALAATIAVTSRSAARARRLSFEDRVAAQRAIEAVYHRHRLWPTDNPQPKPALDEVLAEAALRAKVEDYLRQSRALELWRARAITAVQPGDRLVDGYHYNWRAQPASYHRCVDRQ